MPTAFITGASQGIGAAIARRFAKQPDSRIALVSRSEDKLSAVSRDCVVEGADTLILPCDVTDPAAVTEVTDRVLQEWGAPDLLINNAGQFVPGGISETSPEDFRYQIDVNLNSAFYVTHAFLETMKRRASGLIVFTASVASVKAYPGGAAYCAGKHGLLGLARVTREDTKGTGVRSTALILGATYTPSWESSGLPEERFIPVEDVASIVLDLYAKSDRTIVEEILIRPGEGDI